MLTPLSISDRFTEGWCSLAYWEQSHRVGPVKKVSGPTVNVVSDLQSCHDDICLTNLAVQASNPKLAANTSTRNKVGAGIMISHEGDSMWVYNRSTQPAFVHSLSICDVESGQCFLGHSAMVQKLWPGYCMRAYDPR